MSADLNRVTLIGRLTRDPELRQTAGGTSVCSMRLAVSSRVKTAGGEWGDQSNYFDVTLFGRQAENADQYLGKGRRVGIDGRLSWREWEAKDGSKRQQVEVIAQDLFYLDSKPDGQTTRRGGDMPVDQGSAPVDDSDDLPF
jgi:single-strand DNA-binding protein